MTKHHRQAPSMSWKSYSDLTIIVKMLEIFFGSGELLSPQNTCVFHDVSFRSTDGDHRVSVPSISGPNSDDLTRPSRNSHGFFVSMQWCALVTTLQCHCTRDLDPPRRRRRLERDKDWSLQDVSRHPGSFDRSCNPVQCFFHEHRILVLLRRIDQHPRFLRIPLLQTLSQRFLVVWVQSVFPPVLSLLQEARGRPRHKSSVHGGAKFHPLHKLVTVVG